MNTETEYALMKSTLALLLKADGGKKQKKKENAIRQVKARMFIINLNMRPTLPLPEELTMKINHTALMSELKEYENPKYRKGFYNLRDGDITRMLLQFNRKCKQVQSNFYMNEMSYGWVYKKEALQDALDLNGIVWKKSWSVNKLLSVYMSL